MKKPRRLFRKPRPPEIREIWESASDEERRPYLSEVDADMERQRRAPAGCGLVITDGASDGGPMEIVFNREAFLIHHAMRFAFERGHHVVRWGSDVLDLRPLFARKTM